MTETLDRADRLLQTSIGIEVPVWFKFVFLSELLEASMVSLVG